MMEAPEEGAPPETWRLGGKGTRGRGPSMWTGIEELGGIDRRVGWLGTLSEGERFGQ